MASASRIRPRPIRLAEAPGLLPVIARSSERRDRLQLAALDSSARSRGTFYRAGSPGQRRGRKREHGYRKFAAIRGCPRNCERRARVHMATGKPGRPDATGQRPASQETCQRGHPTGGRGVHTERSFAAVTTMPVRSRESNLSHDFGHLSVARAAVLRVAFVSPSHRVWSHPLRPRLRGRKRRNVVSWELKSSLNRRRAGADRSARCNRRARKTSTQDNKVILPPIDVSSSRLGTGIVGASTSVITAEDIERATHARL